MSKRRAARGPAVSRSSRGVRKKGLEGVPSRPSRSKRCFLEALLQDRRRLEADSLRGGDLDRLLGLGVHAHPRLARTNGPRAEARVGEALLLADRLADLLERQVENRLDGLLGGFEALGLRNVVDQFSLGHVLSSVLLRFRKPTLHGVT